MSSLRVSSYVISIPLEDTDDQYMLIHGYTGAIDIATKELATALRKNKEFSEEDSPFGKELLASLKQRGYVTDKSAEEEYAYTAHLADILHRTGKALYKTFTWLIAYDCNFRCPYCYEGEMSDNGTKWSKKTFTREMADRAFNAMLQIEPHRELHSKIITLYGGEPLLRENKETVSYIVHKGKELGYSFIAITNGYDLDAYIDLLGPNLIKHLQITIDGCKDKHDMRRRHYLYGVSFDRIIRNIGLALSKQVTISVRVNTDRDIFDDLSKLKDLFDTLHYTDYNTFSLSSSILYGERKSSDSPILTFNQFFNLHKSIGYKFRCQDFGLYNKIRAAIVAEKCLNLKSVYCSVQTGGYVLDPYGEIYACWETVGNRDLILGTYTDSTIRWTPLAEKWLSQNVSVFPKCKICKYAFLCGGGCPGHKNGKYDFGQTACSGFVSALKYATNRAYQDHLKAHIV